MQPHLKVIIGVDDLQTERGLVTDPRAALFVQRRMECSGYPFTAPWFDDPVAETGDRQDRIFECVKPGHQLNPTDAVNGPPRATYRQVFVWQNEYGLPNVVGVLLPYHTHEPSLSLADDTLLWLASPAFGLMHRDAVWEVPRITPENDPYYAEVKALLDSDPERAAAVYCSVELRVARGETRLYPHSHAGYFDRDFALAGRILERIGFSFSAEELKLLLYWYWA